VNHYRLVARAIAGLAVCGAMTAAALAAPGAIAGAQSPASERAQIRRLLARRAEAFLARDEDAFMATVSRASPAFVRAERRRFRWAGVVPFRAYRLRPLWDDFGDLTRPSDRARYREADDVALVLVEERYRLERIDPRPAVETMLMTFVKDDGQWLVASDSDGIAVGVLSARQLWDLGPVTMRSSEHFSLLTHPCGSARGCAAIPDTLLTLAERAMLRLERHWHAPWHRRVLLVAPSTTEELARMLQATFDVDNFVAFAVSSIETDDDFDYTGHRVLLKWESLAGRSEEMVVTILAHELLHVATRSLSGPFMPTFVEEGIADYVGHDADPGVLAFFEARVPGEGSGARLPRDHEFLTGSADDIYASYQKAHSAVRYFVERWGFSRLVSFYRRLGKPSVAAGTSAFHVDRALRATVGVGLDAFERAWTDSIRT
jgi:hypothetical protein